MGAKQTRSARSPLGTARQTVVQLLGMKLPYIQPEQAEIAGFLVPR